MPLPVPFRGALLLLAAWLAASPARAQWAPAESIEAQVTSSASFLSAHPDMNYRQLGVNAFGSGRYAEALVHFRRAARFADKPSQAMIAQMYWNGQGVPMDRPLAYAWMDLAAERHYKVMLVQRIRYWEALSEQEREQAVRVGRPLYEQYADRVAKPRLEQHLRAARANSAGSRTGYAGNLRVIIPGPNGDELVVDGSQYYQDKYWKPEEYWKWQAQEWSEPAKGKVEVGPMRTTEGK